MEFAQLSARDIPAEVGKASQSSQKKGTDGSEASPQSGSFSDLLDSLKKEDDLKVLARELEEKFRNGELDGKKLAAARKRVGDLLEKITLEESLLEKTPGEKVLLEQVKQLIGKLESKEEDLDTVKKEITEKINKEGRAENGDGGFLGISVKKLHTIFSGEGTESESDTAAQGDHQNGAGKIVPRDRGNERNAEPAKSSSKVMYLEVNDTDKTGDLNVKELKNLKEIVRGKNAEGSESAGKKDGRKMSVTVVDRRGEGSSDSAGFKNTQDGLHARTGSSGNESGIGKGEVNATEQFTVDFKAENTATRDGALTRNSITGQDQSQLLKFLKGGANGDIVRQAGIILKNNNSGEIRLVLKPEKLGNVRIRLNLQDNNIVGKIIVENINVKEVFEHNLESLHRAFRQEGFQTSGLEVSVGGGEQKNGGKGEDKGETASFTGWSTGAAINEDLSAAVQNYYDFDEGMVNLIV